MGHFGFLSTCGKNKYASDADICANGIMSLIYYILCTIVLIYALIRLH